MIRAWARVVRAPLAPTAACDATACLLAGLAAAGRAPSSVSPAEWARWAGASALVYMAGMAANDWADRDRDRRIAPDRPIPSGALRPAAVLVVAALLAAGAVALAPWSRVVVATTVVLAFGYDLLPVARGLVGVPWMGAVRFANASAPLWPFIVAGEMPVTALLAPLGIGLYGAAITLVSTTEEAPDPRRLRTARLLVAAAFALVTVSTWLAAGRPTPGAIGVTLLALGAALSAVAGRTPRPGPPRLQVREMLLGLYFLDVVAAAGGTGDSALAPAALLGLAFGLIAASQAAMRALAARRAPAAAAAPRSP